MKQSSEMFKTKT